MSAENTNALSSKYLNMERMVRSMSEQEFCDMSKNFALKYARVEWPENDDPLDDLGRLVRAIFAFREKIGQPINESQMSNLPKREHKKSGCSKYEEMVAHFSAVLHTIAPVLTVEQWKILLFDLFSEKYGGTKVRIKKCPGKLKKAAAKKLTIKEIQEKLGVSRTYAYKLYREVNKTVKK